MEEQKNEQVSEQPKKLSYEQLQNIAGQLQQQNMQLRRALEQNNLENMFKRLDYLFKVVATPHIFSDEFVAMCVTEIEKAITIPEALEEDKEEESKEE